MPWPTVTFTLDLQMGRDRQTQMGTLRTHTSSTTPITKKPRHPLGWLEETYSSSLTCPD